MTQIDLSQLPKPSLIESLDYETILARRKTAFLNRFKASEHEQWQHTLALESEPVTKLLEESAYLELLLRQRINHAALSTMLPYATGGDLDNVAANLGTQRLIITPADDSTNPPTPAVYESDQRLRYRAQKAFEGITSAGPRGSYEYHALSASAQVKDVGISSPTPGTVLVTLLSTDGNGTASSDLISTVNTALNAEDVRPLCDTANTQTANIIHYTIEAELTLYPEVTAAITELAANEALQTLIEKQHKIGRDITRSAIHHALHQEGVQNVNIISPAADIVVDDVSAAFCTQTTVTVVGRDE